MSLLCHHGSLLVLLVLFAATSDGDATSDTYDPSKCQPQNYTCGGVSVLYPFYLSSATGVLPEYSESCCGYPGLGIICDGGTPILQLDRDNYTVSDINYTTLTISLADADVFDTSCPIVEHNVTVLPAARLFFPTTTADLFFFIGCTFGPESEVVPKPPPKPPTIKPITCGGSEEGPNMSFVLPERDVPPAGWWRGCQAVYKVPVFRDALPDDAQDPGWRKDGYVKALREGFQVTWDRSSGKCSRCEQSNGRCGYNRTGGFLGCLCANGLVDSYGCSSISDSTAPPSGDSRLKRRTILCKRYISSLLLIVVLLICNHTLPNEKNLRTVYRFLLHQRHSTTSSSSSSLLPLALDLTKRHCNNGFTMPPDVEGGRGDSGPVVSNGEGH